MAVPGRRPISIVQGDTYAHEITIVGSNGVTPVNITGRTYAAQIRRDPTISGTPDASFTCTITNGPGGILVVSMSAALTDTLIAAVLYFWDLQETSGASVTTLLAGKVDLLTQVTR